MKHYKILDNTETGLGSFVDQRGSITDIFYSKSINHGCVITNTPGSVRGNHYHNHTIQYTYIVTGELMYYSKPVGSTEAASMFYAKTGDFIISEPLEIHAMKAGENGCVFMAFAEGPRGGQDYETDTVRVDSIIPE